MGKWTMLPEPLEVTVKVTGVFEKNDQVFVWTGYNYLQVNHGRMPCALTMYFSSH